MKLNFTLIFLFISAILIKAQKINIEESISPHSRILNESVFYGMDENPTHDEVVLSSDSHLTLGSGSTIFVDSDAQGSNNGSSWQDAFTDLQSAINASLAGDQIWIASGTYRPQIVNTPADSNFFVVNKPLEIYGGFAGTETSLNQRDWESNPSILSGDINGDDADDEYSLNKSDNTIHVLYISANDVVIDGLEVAYGKTRIGFDPNSPRLFHTFRGGGIHCPGVNIIIQNCKIRQNSAEQAGGIYAGFSSKILVKNCSFESNHANTFAGAMNIGNMNAEISYCKFESNKVDLGVGGAMFLWQNFASNHDSTLISIKNCYFNSNQAPNGAGIQYNNFYTGSRLQVDSSHFIANTAINNGSGGGINLNNYNSPNQQEKHSLFAEISNSVFDGNVAEEGAALEFIQSVDSAGLVFRNNTIKNNYSRYDAAVGIACINDSKMQVEIDESAFENNNAGFAAGALIMNNAQAFQGLKYDINGCQFINNDGGSYAGAIYATNSSGGIGPIGKIENCRFNRNSASLSCGAISSNNEDIALVNCVFEENTAGNSASAICLTVFTGSDNKQALRECQFHQNETLVKLDTTDVWINNGALEIWSVGKQTVEIEKCHFEANVSPNVGGAITLLNEDSLHVSISECSFVENNAITGGAMMSFGIAYGPQPYVELDNCSFERNNSTSFGGAGMISNTVFSIDNSQFDENVTGHNGGHLAISNGSKVNVKNTKFLYGNAEFGGGIMTYLNNPSSKNLYCNFFNTQFIENESTISGGAFYSHTSFAKSFIDFDSCQFASNQSNNGGAISCFAQSPRQVDHEANLSVINSTFEFNVAQITGGAIYNRAYTDTLNFNMDNCIINSNTTLSDNPSAGGGGIFNAGTGSGTLLLFDINNTLFKENRSAGISGGIWNTAISEDQGTKGTITNCQFVENEAKYCCGGLGYAFTEGIIDNCLFENNKTDGLHPVLKGGGGAGFILNKDLKISNSIFTDNFCMAEGSAIRIDQNAKSFQFENILIQDHTGNSSVQTDSDVKVYNLTMINNDEGLKTATNANVHLQNSVFQNLNNYSGSGTVVSQGSNISSDLSMDAFLIGNGQYSDYNNTDALLDASGAPLQNSPCVDAGNPTDITAVQDLAGNDRIRGRTIDIGAFESPFMTSVKNAIWDSNLFRILPNPVSDFMRFEITKQAQAKYDLKIFDSFGRSVFHKQNITTNFINVQSLNSGSYYVIISSNQETYVAKMIKN